MQSDAQISSILSGWETARLNDHLNDAGVCPECEEEARECDCPGLLEDCDRDDDREPYYGD